MKAHKSTSTNLTVLSTLNRTTTEFTEKDRNWPAPAMQSTNFMERLRPTAQAKAPPSDKHQRLMLSVGDCVRERWDIRGYIAGGSFGQVFLAYDKQEKIETAIKLESTALDLHKQRLKMEVTVIRKLQHSKHCPHFYGSGVTLQYSYMVMQLCSRTVAELRRDSPNYCFTPSTTYKLGKQGVTALQDMHKIGFVHRDIKPSNFALGHTLKNYHTLIMLDFGLARRFCSEAGQLRPPRKGVGFRGTVRYASINAFLQKDLGRHDDLLGLVYMMVEQVCGGLPWRRTRERQQVAEMKIKIGWKELCSPLSPHIAQIGEYLSDLTYEQEPQYGKLQKHLDDALAQHPLQTQFDWEINYKHQQPTTQINPPTAR